MSNTGIKNIYFKKNKYEVMFMINRKMIYAGTFKTLDEAIEAKGKYITNHIPRYIPKNNKIPKTGIKNIVYTDGLYVVRFRKGVKTIFRESFKTLKEAIHAKEKYMKVNNKDNIQEKITTLISTDKAKAILQIEHISIDKLCEKLKIQGVLPIGKDANGLLLWSREQIDALQAKREEEEAKAKAIAQAKGKALLAQSNNNADKNELLHLNNSLKSIELRIEEVSETLDTVVLQNRQIFNKNNEQKHECKPVDIDVLKDEIASCMAGIQRALTGQIDSSIESLDKNLSTITASVQAQSRVCIEIKEMLKEVLRESKNTISNVNITQRATREEIVKSLKRVEMALDQNSEAVIDEIQAVNMATENIRKTLKGNVST